MRLKYLVVTLRNRSTAWANGCRGQPDTGPILHMQHFQPSRENPTAVKDGQHIAGSIGTARMITVTSSNVIPARTCGSASLLKFHCQFSIDYVFSPPLLMIPGLFAALFRCCRVLFRLKWLLSSSWDALERFSICGPWLGYFLCYDLSCNNLVATIYGYCANCILGFN